MTDPDPRMQQESQKTRAFLDEAGRFPVLIQHCKVGLEAADGSAGGGADRVSGANRGGPGHPEHRIGAVDQGWDVLEFGTDLVPHRYPPSDCGSILPNAPLVHPSPWSLGRGGLARTAGGAALGHVLRPATWGRRPSTPGGARAAETSLQRFARRAGRANAMRAPADAGRRTSVGQRLTGTPDLRYELLNLHHGGEPVVTLVGTVGMAASAGDGWLIGQRQASGVANRSRCLFCGSAAGPFAEADWLFRATMCVGCQPRPWSPAQVGQPVVVLPATIRPSHRNA
jgi:hypothetical protein